MGNQTPPTYGEVNEWAHCADEFLLTVTYNDYIMSHCDMDGVLQLYEEMARRNIFANCKNPQPLN